MTKFPTGLALLAAVATATAVAPHAAHAQSIAFTPVNVIDVREGIAQPDRTVNVRGDRITAVEPADSVEVPADARVVDGTGKFLIPGLWDMHAHTSSDRITREIPLPLFVANGVTGIRNMAADCFETGEPNCGEEEFEIPTIEDVREGRRRIATGRLIGPRIVAGSYYVNSPPAGEPSTPQYPRTAGDGRAHARLLHERGVDFIKIYDRLSREAYFALADEANRLGLPFAGHVPLAVRASEASEAGQTSPPEAMLISEAADGSGGGSERLVYSSYRPAGWDVYLQGEEGADPRRLTEHPAPDYDATFSPDGRWVVFTSERNGSPDLFALELDGDDPPRLLLRSAAMEDQADVSPDGEWLSFVGTAGGDADVYRIPFRPEATLTMDDAENLTDHPAGDFRPAFSPDGARIAFSTDRDTPPAPNPRIPFALRREGEIYVMDADGEALTRLTRSPGWDGSPAWSADGETLFFYSERETRGEFRIWALGVEVGEARPASPAGRPALSPVAGKDGRLALSTWTESEGGKRWRVASVAAPGDSAVRTESDPAIDCLTPDVHPPTGAVVCHGGPRPEESVADWPGPLLVEGAPETRESRREEFEAVLLDQDSRTT